MAQIAQLSAELRAPRRKKAAKAMRAAGRVPAVIYGRGREPAALSLGVIDVDRLLDKITPASTIVELTVEGASVKTLIREIQRHPLKDTVLHMDFYEIHADEALTLEIPVHLVGSAEGVRNQGGVLDQVLRTVEIEVLPANIPERVELDVSALVIGRSLHVRDLVIPNVVILTDEDTTICTVSAPRVEEAPAVVAEGAVVEGAVTGTEPEVIKKGKVDEEDAEE